MRGPMHLTIAHMSDVHLAPLSGLGALHVNVKRALGLANWMVKRRHVHLRSVVDALVADLRRQTVDHIIVSGDLCNLGLPGEHAAAAHWLETLGPRSKVSVVPGNHDIYCRLWVDHGVERWRPHMTSDIAGEAVAAGLSAVKGFPYVRMVGPVALIGVNSAIPTRPGEAVGEVGEAQLAALGAILERLAATAQRRIVVIHHPPLPGQASKGRDLRDAASLEATLIRHGADLVLHGHNHRDMHAVRRAADGRRIDVVGIASASVGRAYKEEPLGRYNLIRIEPGQPAAPIEIVSRGLAMPGGPVTEVGRSVLAEEVRAA